MFDQGLAFYGRHVEAAITVLSLTFLSSTRKPDLNVW